MTWTPERTERLKQLREQGYTFTAIAEMLGLTYAAVSHKWKRMGLPMQPPAFWNDKDTQTLIRMRERGYSCGIIAKEIGTTRNACIGKAHRLKLAPAGQPRLTLHIGCKRPRKRQGSPPARVNGHAAIRQRVEPKQAPRAVLVALPLEPPKCEPVHLFDRLAWQCAYPLDEPTEWMKVCGGKTVEGKSYCSYHAQICYRLGSQREFDRIASAQRGPQGFGRAGVAE